jgi:uncharacterized membrane protein
VSDKQLALIVYVLYFLGAITAVTAVIGVIIAHIKIATADEITRTHYRFQIRTFWIGVVYVVVGVLLLTIFIGIFVLIWWIVWWLVRNVKGLLLLNENKPIEHPDSWIFG